MLHRVYFVYLPRRYIQFSLCFQMTFRAYRAVFSRAYGAIHQQPTMYAKSANDVRNSSQMQTGLVNLSFENHTKGRVYRFRKVRVWRLSLKFYLPPRFDKKWLFFVGRAAPDRLYRLKVCTSTYLFKSDKWLILKKEVEVRTLNFC